MKYMWASRRNHQEVMDFLLEKYEYDPSGTIRLKREGSKGRKGITGPAGYSTVSLKTPNVLITIFLQCAVWVVCHRH